MDTKLQKYIEQKKRDFLISEGLFDKVYESQEIEHNNDEFPNTEWDTQNNIDRYYKIVPYNISDDDYELLLKLCSTDKKQESNNTAIFMIIVACISYLAGLILGITAGNTDYGFYWNIALTYWVSYFIIGSFFIGLSAIIKK